MRRTFIRLTVLSLVVCGLTLVDNSAAQAAKPRLSVAAAASAINAGQRPMFNYAISKTRKGSKFYLQRKMGSRGAWGNVARLRAKSGRVTAPAVPRGRYTYRVAAIAKPKHHKKIIAGSAARTVLAFSNISFTTWCRQSRYMYSCDHTGDTKTVNGRAFSYQAAFGASQSPSWHDLTFPAASSCRSLSLSFTSDDAYYHTQTAMRVVQQTRDARSAAAGSNQVGHLTASLDGRPFVLSTQYTYDPGHTGSYAVLVAGTLNCYSSTGFR